MPIPLPELDDRTYADLVEEARDLIPVLAPGWTDHNPSDPGIALVELLAWLTEMLLFQVNQIPEAHSRTFLRLLAGPRSELPDLPELDTATRETLRDLHERYRAVTTEDYEFLVGQVWPLEPGAAGLPSIARVRGVAGVNLTAGDPRAPAPAHVNVVVVPTGPGPHPAPSAELATALADFLKPRRLLGARHHVVGPEYVPVRVIAELGLRSDAPPREALEEALGNLLAFYDPLHGGDAGEGWPFGRDVHLSEVYAALGRSPLVEYVERVRLRGPNLIRDGSGQVTGVELSEYQLVRLERVEFAGYGVTGRTLLTWPT